MKVVIAGLTDNLRWTVSEVAEQLDFELVASGGYEIVAEPVAAAEAVPADGPKAVEAVDEVAEAEQDLHDEAPVEAEKCAPEPKATLSVRQEGNKLIVTYPESDPALFYRGLRLLKQNENKKKTMEPITETKAMKELGIMLDCSRNAVRTVAHIKEVVRNLALMGYNQLRLYTEDTYEIEGEPFFGYMRGRYSKAELKEIDEYAARFGVEVVPCIQTLAHLSKLFRWRCYEDVHDISDIMLIGEKKTYELIEKMIATCSECFRSKKIHIGMDEAHYVGRGKYEDKNGPVENRSELILSHLERVVKIAEKYGFTPIMWSDMFFRLAFGDYYPAEGDVSDEVKAKVPKNLRLTYWDYYNTDRKFIDRMFDIHASFKRDYEFAGGAWTWTGLAPCNKFALVQTEAAVASALEKGCDKILITVWGDNGGECSDLAVLPSLVAAAELSYGHSSYDEAFAALTDVPFDKFMALDLCNEVDKYEKPSSSDPSKYMLYSDPLGGLFDTLIKSGEGKVYEEHSKTLRAVEKIAGRYAYLFTTQRALADVLLLKYELGCETRHRYKSGDRKALKALVKSHYEPLVKKIEALYEAFKEQWDKENKPFGFEVQDYRLGGLIRRIEHCAARINDYADGKVDSIPELDEAEREAYGSKHTINFNSFAMTISTGTI